EQSRYDDAEPLLRVSLEGTKRAFGDDHPSTFDAMSNLASLYLWQERYDEAEALYYEALELSKRVLRDGHPTTATVTYNIGCLHATRGEHAQAMAWLRQAADIGFAEADWMAKDPALEALHGAEFERLVERVRRNAATQETKAAEQGSR
ncbi:MAG: tetratricopeptide repeat protein, partial [Acidobacteria bacterium]|nr:tetratricopeptide repeat protein [Acidobacteriota bacterium]